MKVSDFPQELQGIYRVQERFHLDNETNITVDDLSNLFFSSNPSNREFYLSVLENIKSCEVAEDTTAVLIKSLKHNRVLKELSLKSYEVLQGKADIEEVNELTKQLDVAEIETVGHQNDFVEANLGTILQDTYAKPGLRWRLNIMNKMLGSIRQGDLGIILARPEAGKTTFLCSEVSFMAEQTDKPILFINNEEQSKKVLLRLYQASLGATLDDIRNDVEGCQKRFVDLTGDRIKLTSDATDMARSRIEALCATLQPGLIVIDQLDKIKGFKADRDDLMLGAIYQWARELAKKYCPVIGVTQADGTAEGVRWLNMGHVANSKTSKQAEADWILGIGKDSNPGMDTLRFLQLSKNKLLGDPDTNPSLRHGREQVLLDITIARYKDIEHSF